MSLLLKVSIREIFEKLQKLQKLQKLFSLHKISVRRNAPKEVTPKKEEKKEDDKINSGDSIPVDILFQYIDSNSTIIHGLPNIGLTCFMNAALQLCQEPFYETIKESKNKNKLFQNEAIRLYVQNILRNCKNTVSSDNMKEFHKQCSILKEFQLMKLDSMKMNDSIRFFLQLLRCLRKIDKKFDENFMTKIEIATQCPKDSSHRVFKKLRDKDYFLITKGVSVQEFLEEQTSKWNKCRDCEADLNRKINFSKYLLVKPSDGKLSIDINMKLNLMGTKFQLIGVAVSSGMHATCYSKRKGVWYYFNDDDYDVDYQNGKLFKISRGKFPIGILYEKSTIDDGDDDKTSPSQVEFEFF